MRDKCSICNKFADIKPIRKVKCKAFGSGIEYECKHGSITHKWKTYTMPKELQEVFGKALVGNQNQKP